MVHHVGANVPSLAPIFFSQSNAHSAALPFQTATAFAGVRIGFEEEPAGCQKNPASDLQTRQNQDIKSMVSTRYCGMAMHHERRCGGAWTQR